MSVRKTLVPTFLFLLIIHIVAPLAAVAQDTAVSFRSYVIVTLKDKTYQRFPVDTFQFPWVTAEIKNELTCEVRQFDLATVSEIFVLNIGRNECDQRDDWLFDVYFTDHDAIFGFMEVQETAVRGTRADGEEVVIPFPEIEKISFFRRGN